MKVKTFGTISEVNGRLLITGFDIENSYEGEKTSNESITVTILRTIIENLQGHLTEMEKELNRDVSFAL